MKSFTESYLIEYSLHKRGAGRQSVPSRRRLRFWNGRHMGLTVGAI